MIVAETSAASWSGNTTATGSCDDGIGFPEVDKPGNSGSSGGTRCSLLAGAATITLTCSPAATLNATNGGAQANVVYSATVAQVKIDLSGGVVDSSHVQHYLIGQAVGASLESGGLQVGSLSYDWTVVGGAPFISWVVAQDLSSAVYNGYNAETTATLSCFFAQPGSANVYCSCHLNVPAGSAPPDGLDVNVPSSQITVDAPTITKGPTVTVGTSGIYNPNGTPYFILDPPQGGQEGSNWDAQITTPPLCASGQWSYLQLITISLTAVINGQNEVPYMNGKKLNGLQGLDGMYPIVPPNWVTANGADGVGGDSPATTLSSGMTATTAGDQFLDYIMFLPPGAGSSAVPLSSWTWTWSGSATFANGQWSATDTGSAQTGGPTSYPAFPQWNLLILAGNESWGPQ